MPYEGQRASKISHTTFFKEELEKFLSHCNYLKTLTDEEHSIVASHKVHIEPSQISRDWMWASDGSRYIASVYDGAPTTRVGYLKVSQIGFPFEDYKNLMPKNSRHVDPISVAKLKDAISSIVWMLPGSNIKYKSADSAYEGFRLRLHELFLSTKINESSKSLYSTLFLLRKNSKKNKCDTENHLFIKECPQCHHKHEGDGICFKTTDDGLPCNHCGKYMYASDVLGLHLDFEEHGANESLFTRVMSVLEVMLLAQRLSDKSEEDKLSKSIFFYDGLLSLYGDCSWVCHGLLDLYHKVRREFVFKSMGVPIIVGIAKTGQLMKHAEVIMKNLSVNDIVPISLNYRRIVLKQGVDDPRHSFFSGRWGQEFVWKTEQGKPVVISIPFWTGDFEANRETIHKVENYPELAEVIGVLAGMDCALYPSAFVPIVMAHEEASISWEPGGRLLTQATKRALGAGNGAD